MIEFSKNGQRLPDLIGQLAPDMDERLREDCARVIGWHVLHHGSGAGYEYSLLMLELDRWHQRPEGTTAGLIRRYAIAQHIRLGPANLVAWLERQLAEMGGGFGE